MGAGPWGALRAAIISAPGRRAASWASPRGAVLLASERVLPRVWDCRPCPGLRDAVASGNLQDPPPLSGLQSLRTCCTPLGGPQRVESTPSPTQLQPPGSGSDAQGHWAPQNPCIKDWNAVFLSGARGGRGAVVGDDGGAWREGCS